MRGELRSVIAMAALLVGSQLIALAVCGPFATAGFSAFQDPGDVSNTAIYIIAILAFTGVILALVKYRRKDIVRYVILGSVFITVAFVLLLPFYYALVGLVPAMDPNLAANLATVLGGSPELLLGFHRNSGERRQEGVQVHVGDVVSRDVHRHMLSLGSNSSEFDPGKLIDEQGVYRIVHSPINGLFADGDLGKNGLGNAGAPKARDAGLEHRKGVGIQPESSHQGIGRYPCSLAGYYLDPAWLGDDVHHRVVKDGGPGLLNAS